MTSATLLHQDAFLIRREDQLRALLDVRYGLHLLAQFRSGDGEAGQGGAGLSASEVARRLGEPAPRVSYHVRRLETLGLLVPAPAQPAGRARQLRPVARRFALTPELRGLLSTETLRPFLGALTGALLDSDKLLNSATTPASVTEDLLVLDLDSDGLPAQTPPGASRVLMQTRRLTPAAFERACAAAWDAIRAEPEAPVDVPGARPFTLALLGFAGSVLPLAESPGPQPSPLTPSPPNKEYP